MRTQSRRGWVLFASLIAGAMIPSLASAQDRPAIPPIEFDPPRLNMGVVLPESVTDHVVRVRNTGDEPLRLVEVHKSCSCFKNVQLSSTLINPGEDIDATITYEATPLPNMANVALRFEVADYVSMKTFQVMAQIHQPVVTVPSALSFRVDRKKSGNIRISSPDGEPFRLLAVDGLPPNLVNDDGTVKNRYVISYDYEEILPPPYLVVETDKKDAELLPVAVYDTRVAAHERAFQKGKMRADKRLFNLGVLEPGATFHVDVPIKRTPRQGEITCDVLGADDLSGTLEGYWPESPTRGIARVNLELSQDVQDGPQIVPAIFRMGADQTRIHLVFTVRQEASSQ
ncbi:MAG: DUF1573 domain-containing protein [Planctomycetota bacterium]